MVRRGFIVGLLAGVPFLGRIFAREKIVAPILGIRPYSRETVYVPKTLTGWKAEVDRQVRAIPRGAMGPCAEGFVYPWRIRVQVGEIPPQNLACLLLHVNAEPFGAVSAGCLRLEDFDRAGGFVEFAYLSVPWNERYIPEAGGVFFPFYSPSADFDQIPDA